MGMINWKMVLLSTLAALVILVHSAEEEMELEYHRNMNQRPVDTNSPTIQYNQNWRAIEVDSVAQRSYQGAWDKPATGEVPRRRRRPGRKQKLRPQTELREEADERRSVIEEAPFASEPIAPKPYYEPETTSSQIDVMPKRRRKRPEMTEGSRWSEEVSDPDRPGRRRGLRRKRPFPKYRQKMQHLNVFKPEDPPIITIDSEDLPRPHFDGVTKDKVAHSEEAIEPTQWTESHDSDDRKEANGRKEENGNHNPSAVPNKSASEYSIEFMPVNNESEVGNAEDDNFSLVESIKKAKIAGPIDPQTLKEILKKANGASLSEILQKHNLTLANLLQGREYNVAANNVASYKSPKIESDTDFDKSLPIQMSKIEKANEEPRKDDSLTTLAVDIATTDFYQAPENIDIIDDKYTDQNSKEINKPVQEILDTNEDLPKIMQRRRPQAGGRKRLRLKTLLRNSTLKFPNSRVFSHLITRKQALENKTNLTKEVEISTTTAEPEPTTTTTEVPEPTTTVLTTETMSDTDTVPVTITIPTTDAIEDFDFKFNAEEKEIWNKTEREITTVPVKIEITVTTTTEKSRLLAAPKPKLMNVSELRRQALTNRLKRKRMKQKNMINETTQNDLGLVDVNNLVQASEFIAQSQSPKTLITEKHFKDITNTLEDVLVTEASTNKGTRVTVPYAVTKTASSRAQYSENRYKNTVPMEITTEEIAKIEIEEILSDIMTGERLSRILKERNMTFDELALHRERGSSHVHLADIFHNASREPNPPEPFLSKSSIEPISKETYPLRALIEANHHDPTLSKPSYELNSTLSDRNIPIVMDFRSNVNENGESMGIVSLFNKFSSNDASPEEPSIKRDSDGTPYMTSVTTVTLANTTDNYREARGLSSDRNYVALNEIFSLLQKTFRNESNEPNLFTKAYNLQTTTQKTSLEENLGGEAVEMMEDLQHLNDFDSNVRSISDEKLEMGVYQSHEGIVQPGILEKPVSQTKSVTVVTASIAGLTMIAFLLTYVAIKWRQQRNLLRKKNSFSEEQIPSPVFETRKNNINNCSSRSISPMLPSSNIYTMSSTIDSRNGKESPTYTWDSLRKPFQ